MGRLDKLTVLNVLIVVLLICVSFVVSRQELKRPIFLESIFGLSHIQNDIAKGRQAGGDSH
jgi:uncharacterized membrane protein